MEPEDDCQHDELYIDCTPAAEEAGFKRPDLSKRLAAVTLSGTQPGAPISTHKEIMSNDLTFPGPLGLPGDTITDDPHYKPRSFKMWHGTRGRTPVTGDNRIIYVMEPPLMSRDVRDLMKDWHQPVLPEDELDPQLPTWNSSTAHMPDLVDYLRAFFLTMDVRSIPTKRKWQRWDANKNPKSMNPTQRYIGLKNPGKDGGLFPVRYRQGFHDCSRMQLNVDDIAEALVNKAENVYAIIMLVDFDLYDADNHFLAGQSYPERRVAIMSPFRHNPALDARSEFWRDHMWPASHCKTYANMLCKVDNDGPRQFTVSSSHTTSALSAATRAFREVPEPQTTSQLANNWLSRVCFSASHHLMRCFAVEHCIYYACLMQACDTMRQDVSNPFTELDVPRQRSWIAEHTSALKGFCSQWSDVPQFAAFGAWLGARRFDAKISQQGCPEGCRTPYCSRNCRRADKKAHGKVCKLLQDAVAAGASSSQHRPTEHQRQPPSPDTTLRIIDVTWFHDCPKEEVYRILIDSYRLRMNDMSECRQVSDEDVYFVRFATSIIGFRRYLDIAQDTAGFLPSWWNAEKREECEAYCAIPNGGHTCKLSYWQSVEDIARDYNDDEQIVLRLRLLAQVVFGCGPGGKDVTTM
ncbi:hypothetical protein FZEAL_8218 [Fusarium zealandicum]|uniref:MYND-type domain-containing protein n=1 Tax=Fusarium zealandicum TaxID=1053134 RepID=A0A8H4UEG9_9HYPO|nr:hypothetical protein FZEAL_8218 [Fusarium zealandicum]